MPKRQQEPGPKPQAPAPGRSTSEAAFNALRKEIAQRNERAHQDARKVRAAHDLEQIRKRRERDAL